MFGNTVSTRVNQATDAGLSAHMRQVFNYMTGGVALSGLVAWLCAQSEGIMMTFATSPGMMIALAFGLMFVAIFLQVRIMYMQPSTALGLFVLYSAGTGFIMSPIFLIYTGASIATAFFTAAGMFAGLSLWGYVTKRNLTGLGNFLVMGVWGIVIASILNMFFFKDGGFSMVISYISIPVFAGLTAYFTQQVKDMYYQVGGDELMRTRVSILGAVWLYISFIALFQHLLHIMGAMRGE
jgi:FtsH-binding integral membrane protein